MNVAGHVTLENEQVKTTSRRILGKRCSATQAIPHKKIVVSVAKRHFWLVRCLGETPEIYSSYDIEDIFQSHVKLNVKTTLDCI